jgi:hypothetical protein
VLNAHMQALADDAAVHLHICKRKQTAAKT